MMEMGSHVWEMFVWTKQGNITTSAPPVELSRLNSCEQLAVTVVRTTHEKLLFTSEARCGYFITWMGDRLVLSKLS